MLENGATPVSISTNHEITPSIQDRENNTQKEGNRSFTWFSQFQPTP